MASAPQGHWKSLCIMHLATCQNQNSPTDSADEAGVEDLAHLLRDAAADRRPGQHERASRRARRRHHHLGPPRSGRLGWLGIRADGDGRGATAPYPAVRPCPPGAGPRRGAEHDRNRAARQPAGRRSPPGPPRAEHRGQRPRPQHPAARRRLEGPERDAARSCAGRPGPSRAAGGRRAADLRHGRGQWVDAAPPLARVAPVRDARQAGGASRNRTTARSTLWCSC